eukprot:GFUD01006406.1.p1 GENE.GFUD01006406.1~~GFUD01006406.1.p1  ORF type:complete len:496 (+),score=106.82 GFUD01006406.1:604-2091(+)
MISMDDFEFFDIDAEADTSEKTIAVSDHDLVSKENNDHDPLQEASDFTDFSEDGSKRTDEIEVHNIGLITVEEGDSLLHNIKEETETGSHMYHDGFSRNSNYSSLSDSELKGRSECSYCHMLVVNLEHHIEKWHENPSGYKCEHCGKRLNQLRGLKKHVRRMHNNVIKHTCPVCFKKCLDIDKHISQVHANPEHRDKHVKCEQCDYTATSRSNLWSHIGYVHKIVTWGCPECGQEINKLNKSRHMRQHKDKSFSCIPCKKSFQNRLILARHVLYAHKHHRNKCVYCLKNVTNLKFHVQAAHKEVDSSTIDISCDTQMIFNIKVILGVTRVYNGEIDNYSLDKIRNLTNIVSTDQTINDAHDEALQKNQLEVEEEIDEKWEWNIESDQGEENLGSYPNNVSDKFKACDFLDVKIEEIDEVVIEENISIDTHRESECSSNTLVNKETEVDESEPTRYNLSENKGNITRHIAKHESQPDQFECEAFEDGAMGATPTKH